MRWISLSFVSLCGVNTASTPHGILINVFVTFWSWNLALFTTSAGLPSFPLLWWTFEITWQFSIRKLSTSCLSTCSCDSLIIARSTFSSFIYVLNESILLFRLLGFIFITVGSSSAWTALFNIFIVFILACNCEYCGESLKMSFYLEKHVFVTCTGILLFTSSSSMWWYFKDSSSSSQWNVP